VPHPRRWSLARQLLALQAGVVVLAVLLAAGLAYLDARRDAGQAAAEQATVIALSVADTPVVAEALDDPDPSAVLQPFVERVRRDTSVDFIVVMSTDRTRWTHPVPGRIGEKFVGTIEPALRGRTFTETYAGTLGPSVRAVTPVRGPDGQVRALVSVGITLDAVGADLRRQLPVLLAAALAVLALAVGGTALVGRRLARVTHGLGPEELARMYTYYDAVLHSVREGLLLLDAQGRLRLANDEARRLLDLPERLDGVPVVEAGLPPGLAAALASGRDLTDEIHLARDRVLVVSSAPATEGGRLLGRVVTLRDHTDLQALTGELDTARGLAEALRSQAHEAAGRLHTVVSLIELGRAEEAAGFATEELRAAQALTDRVMAEVSEPVVAALLLGKAAVAAERGVDLVVADGTALEADVLDGTGVTGRDLVTVLGNLVDNAIDAAAAAPPPRRVEVLVGLDGGDLLLRVADTGPGLDGADSDRAFRRGWSTKDDGGRLHGRGLGLALVGQTVHRLGGTVDVGRGVGAVFTVRLPVGARVGARR
jgi:two-component system CitB family sensor kinase